MYTYDPEKAKELVKAAGAEGAEITLIHATDPPGPEAAASQKENLEAAGFKVKLKGLSSDVVYGFLADPKSEWNLAGAAWAQDYPDAITYYGPLLLCEAGSNYGLWCDKDFDAKVAEINQLPPGADRDAQFAALSTETMQNQAPWWPKTSPRFVSFISERYVIRPAQSGPKKTWTLVRSPVTAASWPIPVIPDCQGAASRLPGSHSRDR